MYREKINRVIITGKELFSIIITSAYRSSAVSGTGRASGLSIFTRDQFTWIYDKIQIQYWTRNIFHCDIVIVILVFDSESSGTDPSGSKNK